MRLSFHATLCFASASVIAAPVDFTRDIKPIFDAHCTSCHAAEKHKRITESSPTPCLRREGSRGDEKGFPSSFTCGGALIVTNLAGTLTNGQTFQLFSASGTKAGTFTSITPALAGGKAWSFNPTKGVLSVVSGTANYPTNISLSFSGGTITLTWPATHLGWIAQSNSVSLASPSNLFDIPGSSGGTSLNIVPGPANANVFYRLRLP